MIWVQIHGNTRQAAFSSIESFRISETGYEPNSEIAKLKFAVAEGGLLFRTMYVMFN